MQRLEERVLSSIHWDVVHAQDPFLLGSQGLGFVVSFTSFLLFLCLCRGFLGWVVEGKDLVFDFGSIDTAAVVAFDYGIAHVLGDKGLSLLTLGSVSQMRLGLVNAMKVTRDKRSEGGSETGGEVVV